MAVMIPCPTVLAKFPESGYGDTLLDHFDHPRHVGALDRNSPHVGSALAEASAYGEKLELYIQIDGNKIIEAACFKAQGGVATIAAGSLLTEWLIGKTLPQALEIHNQALVTALAIPSLKIYAAVLAEKALKLAVNDLLTKQSNQL